MEALEEHIIENEPQPYQLTPTRRNNGYIAGVLSLIAQVIYALRFFALSEVHLDPEEAFVLEMIVLGANLYLYWEVYQYFKHFGFKRIMDASLVLIGLEILTAILPYFQLYDLEGGRAVVQMVHVAQFVALLFWIIYIFRLPTKNYDYQGFREMKNLINTYLVSSILMVGWYLFAYLGLWMLMERDDPSDYMTYAKYINASLYLLAMPPYVAYLLFFRAVGHKAESYAG